MNKKNDPGIKGNIEPNKLRRRKMIAKNVITMFLIGLGVNFQAVLNFLKNNLKALLIIIL